MSNDWNVKAFGAVRAVRDAHYESNILGDGAFGEMTASVIAQSDGRIVITERGVCMDGIVIDLDPYDLLDAAADLIDIPDAAFAYVRGVREALMKRVVR